MRTALCSLLLASSVAVAAPVPIGVAPSGVVVRFDMQNSPGFTFVSDPFPGVEVGLLLTPSGEKVQLAAGREGERLVCTDSTGKDLGKVTMIPLYSMGVVLPPQYGCAVAAREAPAPEAQWIHVKGTLPVQVLDGEEQMEPVTLEMKKGATASVGHVALKVENAVVKDGSITLNLKLSRKNRDVPVGGILFQKMDGTPLEAKCGTRHIYLAQENYAVEYEYAIPSDDAELKVVLFKKTGREVQVPLDLKVGLGGPAR
ncbi:MAG: hypothetical protein LUE13_10620 [Akkermansiaceae bacterium]|nr:hypothetical protein [Akkermansiaceae bacterium]